MEIRAFEPKDAAEVSRLSNRNIFAFSRRVNPEFLRRMNERKDYLMIVACEGPELLGFAGISLGAGFPEIGPVCVAKGRRRQGIGSLLVGHMLSTAGRLGARGSIIKVKASNNEAQDFFASMGFEKIGEACIGAEAVIIMRYGPD